MTAEQMIVYFVGIIVLAYLINDCKNQIMNYIEIVRNELLDEIRKQNTPPKTTE